MVKYIQIVIQVLVLFGFYFIGSWIKNILGLAIPGSIIGMLLLFLLLLAGWFPTKWIDKGASLLLSHLPLLFIPVTVGIMEYFDLFKGKGFLSIIIVVVSTIIVMVVSALVSQWTANQQMKKQNRLTNKVEKSEQA